MSTFHIMSVFFDLVKDEDVADAHTIELAGYPKDEAASLEAFRYRQREAPELFLGAYLPDESGRKLVGYVCATTSRSPSLTHESMSTHEPGPSVCIHSVCIAPDHRRKGVGLALLKEYLSRLESQPDRLGYQLERVLLITHEDLRSLYEKAGIEWAGESAVVHGSRPWFEMRKVLKLPHSQSEQPISVPADIWEQLQRASTSRNRPQAVLLSAFPNGAQDLVADDGQGSQQNQFDLLCPRDGCGSVILKACAGSLVERESVPLDPSEVSGMSASPLAPLPPPPATMNWWLVTPNAMAFENIGFTRPVTLQAADKKLKLLICAECDLGPLGWCEEGGCEFWLAVSRVGYRK